MIFNMLIGLSGSGKTSYAENLKDDDTVIVSSDRVRDALYGSEEYQGNPEEVFSAMRSEAVAALSVGKNVVYDATNLTRKHRVALLENLKARLKDFDVRYVCTIILAPFEDCLKRNSERSRKVPEYVIYNQLKSFHVPLYEGWDEVHVVPNYINYNRFYEKHHNLLPVNKLYGLPQSGKYHTEDADIHSLMALMWAVYPGSTASDRVKGIALFHDIGKGYCHTVDDEGNNHFYGHENAGAYLYMTMVFPDHEEHELLSRAFLIQIHDILKTKNKIINFIDEKMKEDLRQINEIDERATIRPEGYYENIKRN